METRLQWGGALALALLMAVLTLLLSQPAPAGAGANQWVRLEQARLLDVGAHNALMVQINGQISRPGRLVSDMRAQEPARKMVLLNSPRAGGTNFSRFEDALKKALKPANWTLAVENLSALGRKDGGRILVLPSGAWPAGAIRNWSDRFGPKDTVVYVGIRQDITINDNGQSRTGGVPPVLLLDGRGQDGYGEAMERLEFENTTVLRLARTLDEYEDLDALAGAVAAYSYDMPDGSVLARASSEWTQGRLVQTLNASPPLERAWVRVRLLDADGKLLRLWDRPLSRPSGHLDGPAQILSFSPISLQARLTPDWPQDENLEYYAQIYSSDAKLWARQKIGQGLLEQAQNGSRGAWVGAFTVNGWPGSGMNRIEVADQFGRVLAEAGVYMPKISIEALDAEGLTRRYRLLRDGEPINASEVLVKRLNATEWTVRPASDGIVLVAAKWPPGNQTLQFKMDGQVVSYQWSEGEGAWAPLWQYGLPGLLLVVAVYALLRPRQRSAYRLIVPEFSQTQAKKMEMKRDELEKMLRLACRDEGRGSRSGGRNRPAKTGSESARRVLGANELAEFIRAQRGANGKWALDPSSVQEALMCLAKEGRAVGWRGFYSCLKKGLDEKTVRRLAMARLLKDGLMMEGLPLKEERHRLTDGEGNEWMIWEQESLGALARQKSRLPARILFEDDREKEDARKKILAGWGRLGLALQTGRMKLVSLDEFEKTETD